MSKVVKQIDSHIKKIKKKSLTEIQIFAMRNLFLTFVQNARSNKQKKMLVEIIKNTDWFYSENAYQSIRSELYSISGEFCIIKYKNHNTSSSKYIINRLIGTGFIGNKEVIDKSKISNLKSKTKLIVFDDFVGTGDTVLKDLDSFYDKHDIIITCHTISNDGYQRLLKLEQAGKITFLKRNVKVVKDYKTKFDDKDILSYINTICSKDEKFALGYGDLGLMLSYEGISPNNNISMLWRDEIKLDGSKWVPLFNRDINFERMSIIKQNIFSKNISFINRCFDEYKYLSISFNGFKLAYAVFLGINKVENINKIIGFESNEKLKMYFNNLLNENILQRVGINNFEIINQNLKSGFLTLTNDIIKYESGEAGFRKISNNKYLSHKYHP